MFPDLNTFAASNTFTTHSNHHHLKTGKLYDRVFDPLRDRELSTLQHE